MAQGLGSDGIVELIVAGPCSAPVVVGVPEYGPWLVITVVALVTKGAPAPDAVPFGACVSIAGIWVTDGGDNVPAIPDAGAPAAA